MADPVIAVRLHPQLQRMVDRDTEPCEVCTTRGRPMKPPAVLAPGWYEAVPAEDGTAVEWHPHDPAGCRARRPDNATAWAKTALLRRTA